MFDAQLFERSSGKAFLRLTKAIVLLTTAYAFLTVMPWYLLPLGWIITGTCFASVRSFLSLRLQFVILARVPFFEHCLTIVHHRHFTHW